MVGRGNFSSVIHYRFWSLCFVCDSKEKQTELFKVHCTNRLISSSFATASSLTTAICYSSPNSTQLPHHDVRKEIVHMTIPTETNSWLICIIFKCICNFHTVNYPKMLISHGAWYLDATDSHWLLGFDWSFFDWFVCCFVIGCFLDCLHYIPLPAERTVLHI